jgi:6-phosphogluconate dehydrogenase
MRIAMVGLGRMGAGMTARLRSHGHDVVRFDTDPARSDAESLEALVAVLDAPRIVWVMRPSGPATDGTIDALRRLLGAGDLVVNGANDRYDHDAQLAGLLAPVGVDYIDAGVSGGIWGETEGFCLMVGGAGEPVARLRPIFEALAPPNGFVHAGPIGAGHYAKMVHNGIEYAMMQAYGEGYELLKASELGIDVDATVAAWRTGSVVRSWLLELLVSALESDPGLASIQAWADDTGEGRWTVEESIRLAVPTPTIASALYARFSSRIDASPTMKVVAALRKQFGGHAVKRL